MNEPFAKLGTLAPFLGLSISHTTVNLWLQSSSLVIGIVLGLLSLIAIIRKK
jgi:hypothetical protein